MRGGAYVGRIIGNVDRPSIPGVLPTDCRPGMEQSASDLWRRPAFREDEHPAVITEVGAQRRVPWRTYPYAFSTIAIEADEPEICVDTPGHVVEPRMFRVRVLNLDHEMPPVGVPGRLTDKSASFWKAHPAGDAARLRSIRLHHEHFCRCCFPVYYGIVGDLFEVVPLLEKEFQALLAE